MCNTYPLIRLLFYHYKDFDSDSSADNIAFLVKRLKVYTDPNAAGYKFNGHYSVEKFLDLHSINNYDDYCLSYMFADRDFDGGVLGLAWVASLSKAGGVCEIYRVCCLHINER